MFLRFLKLLILFIICMVVTNIVAHLDGLMFPVVTHFHITTIRDEHSDSTVPTLIYGEFMKNRACSLESMKFFFGQRGVGNSVAVPVEIPHIPVIRSIGTHAFGPLRVYLSKTNIEKNSWATITHDCYGGWLWKTTTLVYDSSDSPQISTPTSE